MIKFLRFTLLLSFVFIASSCSCSKEDLINLNDELIEQNKEILSKIEQYDDIEGLFNFYNTITTDNINSFVLVESKNQINSLALYSDGVVVANNGYDYYILTDYNKIFQPGIVEYKIMDSNANVYNAQVFKDNDVIYDSQT